MASSVREVKLEEKLKEAGARLLNPPSSIDQLLNLLDKVECLLAIVAQAPSRSMQDALLPSMKALIASELLRNSDTDVRVSVASCISEITRITAPDTPYCDEKMKEIFQLTVAAFENLSHLSGRRYTKAVSILDTVAKVRSCLVMLDLECDELIVEMFQHFLRIIRSNHSHAVFSAMETIMSLVLDESEDISWDLLRPLLASVKKENQNTSPISCKLGEKVITDSAAKLKPYLLKAVQIMGIALDDYAPVVGSICRNGLDTLKVDQYKGSGWHLADEHRTERMAGSGQASLVTRGLPTDAACSGEVLQDVDGHSKRVLSNGIVTSRNNKVVIYDSSSKVLEQCSLLEHSKTTKILNGELGNLGSMKEDILDIEREIVPRKRGRRPNSLMNPEEGYDPSWICGGRKTPKTPHFRISVDRKVGSSLSEDPASCKAPLWSSDGKMIKPLGSSSKVTEIKGASSPSPNGESHPRRGRPKKKGIMMNQDADPKSLSLSRGVTFRAQVGEKALQFADVKLEKELEDRRTETKQQKRSTIIGLAAKAKEEKAQVIGHLISEKETELPTDSEETQVKKSVTELGTRNINEDISSVRTDIKKRRLVNATLDGSSAKVSGAKITPKSEVIEGCYLVETPKTKLKRKLTAAKGMVSKMPDLGESLVGKNIKVWWPIDKMFYEGVIDFYDHVKRKHRVLYADGDEEVLNLNRQRWEVIADDAALDDVGQRTDLPKPNASSDLHNKTVQKKKGKVKSESPKQGKAYSSFKRKRTPVSVSKIAEKSADMVDSPIVFAKPMDDASGIDCLKFDGNKCIEMLESETLKTGTDFEQIKPEVVSPHNAENVKCSRKSFGVGIPKVEYLDYLVEMNKGAIKGRRFFISPETNESVYRDKGKGSFKV
ncbi:hypothetical protein CFOL_v3_15849 [Cephalotus follicularis]|uniref:Uncharacterized protein n=1 Tax=Cephalotus follicularis TaxID=3775 RepID=A0A1Q3BWS0_CEPFO|nr:hypothetical protein CFOL_v3_15849 [Cephalotus follicularis]